MDDDENVSTVRVELDDAGVAAETKRLCDLVDEHDRVESAKKIFAAEIGAKLKDLNAKIREAKRAVQERAAYRPMLQLTHPATAPSPPATKDDAKQGMMEALAPPAEGDPRAAELVTLRIDGKAWVALEPEVRDKLNELVGECLPGAAFAVVDGLMLAGPLPRGAVKLSLRELAREMSAPISLEPHAPPAGVVLQLAAADYEARARGLNDAAAGPDWNGPTLTWGDSEDGGTRMTGLVGGAALERVRTYLAEHGVAFFEWPVAAPVPAPHHVVFVGDVAAFDALHQQHREGALPADLREPAGVDVAWHVTPRGEGAEMVTAEVALGPVADALRRAAKRHGLALTERPALLYACLRCKGQAFALLPGGWCDPCDQEVADAEQARLDASAAAKAEGKKTKKGKAPKPAAPAAAAKDDADDDAPPPDPEPAGSPDAFAGSDWIRLVLLWSPGCRLAAAEKNGLFKQTRAALKDTAVEWFAGGVGFATAPLVRADVPSALLNAARAAGEAFVAQPAGDALPFDWIVTAGPRVRLEVELDAWTQLTPVDKVGVKHAPGGEVAWTKEAGAMVSSPVSEGVAEMLRARLQRVGCAVRTLAEPAKAAAPPAAKKGAKKSKANGTGVGA